MKKNNPTIFLGIPCYNQSKYLVDTFHSILDQTYNNIVVLISDDCSTDNSKDVINEYREIMAKELPYPPVVFLQPENIGVWDNLIFMQDQFKAMRDRGQIYNTDLMAYLEGDDCLYPERFQEQVDYLQEHYWMTAVHSDVTEFYENGYLNKGFWKRNRKNQPGGKNGIPSGMIRKPLEQCNFIYTCSFLCNAYKHLDYYKSRWFKNDLGLYFGDYAFFLSLSKDHEIGYIDKDLSFYRNLPTSLSHDPEHRPQIIESTRKMQDLARKGIL